MDIPNGGELPDEATVIFHVSGGKKYPRMGPCESIDAEAIKCDDDGISVTWVEHFPDGDQFNTAAITMRGDMKVRKTGVVARVTVGALREAFGEPDSVKVIREKIDGNTGHCLIKGVSVEEIGKRLALAKAVTDFVAATDIPDYVND